MCRYWTGLGWVFDIHFVFVFTLSSFYCPDVIVGVGGTISISTSSAREICMCKGAGTVPDEEAAACSSLAKALQPVPTPGPSSTLGLAVEPTLEPLALPSPIPESIVLPSASTLTPYLPRLSVLLRNSTCLAEKPARGASNEDRMRLPGSGPEMGPLRLITEDEAEVGVAPPKEDKRLENRVIG